MSEINHYDHEHTGDRSSVSLGHEFDGYRSIQLHSVSLVNNFKNVTALMANNKLHTDLVGTSITVPDGNYDVNSLNSSILDGTLFKIILSNAGPYYALISYPTQLDKTNGTNPTEIVGHEGVSNLNFLIYHNTILVDRIKMYCNIFDMSTNLDALGLDVNYSTSEIIPITVNTMSYQLYSATLPIEFSNNGANKLTFFFTTMDG